MKWNKVSEGLSPKDETVLVYSRTSGFYVATYNYYPAWKPFDEKVHEGLPEELKNSLRRLNECSTGEPERHRWGCACEDSYWDIDYFAYWANLPKEPK